MCFEKCDSVKFQFVVLLEILFVGTGVLNIGMIATGNHCYLKIRCALQHLDGPD